MTKGNLFFNLPHRAEEVMETLLETEHMRIERITSSGQASPPGFWYDQESHEWVLVVQGRAALLFEGWSEPMILEAGDWINIPAHQKHRVEWTDAHGKTLWLAVHYRQDPL